MKLKTILTVIALGVGLIASASAVTLYQDDFSGSASNPLNGTTPDITIGANTWAATTGAGTLGFKANGSFSGTGTAQSALLAFAPVSDNIYTLSANLSLSADNGLLLLFGNAGTNVFAGEASLNNTASVRIDNFGANVKVAYSNSAADGEFTYINGPLAEGSWATGLLAQIVLNTSTPIWSASFSYGGTPLGSISNITPGNIDRVGFSTAWFAGPTGSFDNFTLSVEPVPEPSTVALLFVGLGVITLRRRMRTLSGRTA